MAVYLASIQEALDPFLNTTNKLNKNFNQYNIVLSKITREKIL